MLGFIPDGYRHAITDREERWLHGDESCRPANVQHVGPQVPEDMLDGSKAPDDALPLCSFGQGDYVHSYTPQASRPGGADHDVPPLGFFARIGVWLGVW